MIKIQRLYEITVVQNEEYVYFAITTNEFKAQDEYDKLRELNKEDRIGLYSQDNHCSKIDNIQRIK